MNALSSESTTKAAEIRRLITQLPVLESRPLRWLRTVKRDADRNVLGIVHVATEEGARWRIDEPVASGQAGLSVTVDGRGSFAVEALPVDDDGSVVELLKIRAETCREASLWGTA